MGVGVGVAVSVGVGVGVAVSVGVGIDVAVSVGLGVGVAPASKTQAYVHCTHCFRAKMVTRMANTLVNADISATKRHQPSKDPGSLPQPAC